MLILNYNTVERKEGPGIKGWMGVNVGNFFSVRSYLK